MANKHMKDASHMISGKSKLKNETGLYHILELPKSITLTIPNASDNVEQLSLGTLIRGCWNCNGTATFEVSWFLKKLICSYWMIQQLWSLVYTQRS